VLLSVICKAFLRLSHKRQFTDLHTQGTVIQEMSFFFFEMILEFLPHCTNGTNPSVLDRRDAFIRLWVVPAFEKPDDYKKSTPICGYQ